jgi:hypothetical protein
MRFSIFLLYLLLTFTTSALLVSTLLIPAKRGVAGIGLLIFWLSNLIVPVQLEALLELMEKTSALGVRYLFFWSGLAFACALVLWLTRPKRPGGEQVETISELGPNSRPASRHVAFGLLIVLSTYGVLSLRMAFSFPDAWDSVAYHYPIALRWLQEGTLSISRATNWHASLPGNVEILDFLVLSTGRDRLLGFVQWPGLIILTLACLQLASRVGKSAAPAWPVATTALMIPLVANQSMSGYVDLFGTALLFGGLTLVLEYGDRVQNSHPRSGLLLAAGLGCGLAVGTKPVFWLFAAVFVIGASGFLLSSQGGWASLRAWRGIAVFLLATAVPSGFWFARAAWCTGNPFFPFAIHVGSFSLAGIGALEMSTPENYLAPIRHWVKWFAYPWVEWQRDPGSLLTNYMVDSGLGGGFATFAMPGAAFAVWLARRRRPDLRVWLFALGVLGAVWWFPLQKTPRYGLPLFVLAVVLSAPFFDVLERHATRLYRTIYVLAFAITGCILAFGALYTITETIRYRAWNRAAYFGYPEIIDGLTPGSNILNLGSETLNFPLAGRNLTNRVVPSWERPRVLTADFLRSRQVDFVVEKRVHSKGAAAVDDGPPLDGLQVFFASSVKEGERVAEWRIWSASHTRE